MSYETSICATLATFENEDQSYWDNLEIAVRYHDSDDTMQCETFSVDEVSEADALCENVDVFDIRIIDNTNGGEYEV